MEQTFGLQQKNPKLSILVVSDFDSRAKWGISLAENLIKSAGSYDLIVASGQLCYMPLYSSGGSGRTFQTDDPLSFLETLELGAYQVLICALGGHANIKLSFLVQKLSAISKKRPLLIGGFNGITDRNDPDAILVRSGLDLVAVNCLADFQSFKETFDCLHYKGPQLFVAGYQRKCANVNSQPSARRKILFVQQPGLPQSKKAFLYLARRLNEIAQARSDAEFVIIFRREEGQTINKFEYPARKLWNYVAREFTRENIRVADGQIEGAIADADEVWSISSTALAEAMSLGKDVICLSDFGISKRNGNQYFIGSGLFQRISDSNFISGRAADPRWMEMNVPRPLDGSQLSKIVEVRLKSLRENNYRFTMPYYSLQVWNGRPLGNKTGATSPFNFNYLDSLRRKLTKAISYIKRS